MQALLLLQSTSVETTVALDPEQLETLVEHGQGNTFALMGWLAIMVMCLGAIALMLALRGR
ncbi:hypothetical protein [Rubrobacter aplysinae]|uniref:hypothetical protein n=1 Tax=Rubrobacter aplysinae TaxID=909625 RepID=UPI00064BB710|nr:hypothetical protein [Rubrobacter aplysinae]